MAMASDGVVSNAACEFSLWTTGQNLRNAPALRSRLDPGGPLVVHGIQGLPASPVRDINTPPWLSYTVAYGDRADNPRAAGHLGSLRIYAKPCAAPAVYSGPGYPASPPYTVVTVMPEDCIFGRRCSPPPGPEIDIGIAKIGERNVNNPDGPYNFTIGARNLAGPITTPQTITITDIVPAGMTFTNVTSTNWNCLPVLGPPIPAGGTLTCTYSGTFPIATAQLLGTISIVATGGDGPYQNCAALAPGDRNTDNDRACVTVQKPPLDVKLEKKLSGTMGPHFMFDIDVSNVGTAFVNGNFTVTDAVPSGMTVMSATGGWTCNTPVTGPNPLLCTLPVASIPLGATLPTIKLTTLAPGPGPWENCAVVSVITTSGTDTNPANDKGCATVAKEQVGELIIEKKVVYTGELVMPSLTYPVTVTCGSWNQTFNLVPNVPQSAGGVPLNVSCAVTETLPPAPASACPAPKVATWQTPPVVSPATPFQLSGVSTSVTVTNTLDCKGGESGTLIVTKQVINNTTIPVPTSSVYAISASCVSGMSPAVATAMPLNDGGSQTVGGLALSTVCTITETPPTPPSTGPVSCGAPGSTLEWTVVLPAPVTITGPATPALVQNILNCNPPGGGLGTLVVTKSVLNKTQGQVSTVGLIYPFSVNCASGGSPAVVSTFNITENSSYTVSNIALNSSCTITEPSMPAPTGACATVGAVPTWQTPVITPSSPVPVNGTSVAVTVQNIMECVPAGGYLLVQKQITKPNNVPLSAINALTFPVVVTCDGNTTPLNVTFGTSAVVHNIPFNQVCSVVETLPPAPNVPNVCPAGQALAWTLPPTYTPASATISPGPGKTIVVRNTLACAPSINDPTGSLIVTKTVANNTGAVVAGMAFPANLSCSSGMSPAVVTPLTLSHGSTQTIGSIALGSTCTVSETLPAPPTAGCGVEGQIPTWTTTYTPPIASIPADTSIAVLNSLDCKAGGSMGGGGGGAQTSQLLLQKVVVSQRPAQPPPTQTFPVTATCGGNAVTRNMVHNTNQAVGQVPYGTCTINEPTPPVLPGSCPAGWTGTWTSVYPATVAINQPTHVVNVTNTLTCTEDGGKGGPPPIACILPLVQTAVPGQCACPPGTVQNGRECVKQATCKAPMVAGAVPGQCVCPAGTTKRGERCVATVVCRSPAKVNSQGTGCTCPQGMNLKGNTCVKEERKRPAVTPNDVIRVVPGLIGPGGFGGGGRTGGGSSGGDKGGGGAGGGGGYKPPGVR